MRKYWKQFTVISFVVGILMLPLFSQIGFPYTHDGQNHMARMSNYYLALKQGQLPPRWAPNLDAGFGYTSLNFNYPLANILSVPFTILNFRIDTTLKILFTLSLWIGGVGMFLFLRKKFSQISSLIASIVYILAPYQLVNIYVRGNIGESMAFGILPWILYLMHKNLKIRFDYSLLIVAISLFLLSHNLIAILGIMFVAFIAVIYKKDVNLPRLAKSFAMSLLLVSFFWIPALWEKQFIVLEDSPLNLLSLQAHFSELRQLISSAWSHGFSYSSNVDGMSFAIGFLGVLGILLSLVLIIAKKQSTAIKWVFSATIFMIFMTLPQSIVVWKLFPIASIIQFPWRLLFFINILSVILIASVVKKSSKKVFISILIFILITISKKNLAINFESYDNHYWMNFPLNTTILNENDPIWFQRGEAYEIKGNFEKNIISSEELLSKTISRWNGTNRKYEINTKIPTSIVESTIYFPGWETKIDGKKIDNHQFRDRYFGLINFEVPAGKHTIETKFTQNTPARIIGNGLSILGIFIFIYQIKQYRKDA